MKQWIKGGHLYYRGQFDRKVIGFEDGIITDIVDEADFMAALVNGNLPHSRMTTGSKIYDAEDGYIIPGFIDIHTHGAVGVDVNGADEADFEKISQFFARQGTTSWQCSILTDTKEQTLHAIKEAVRFIERQKAEKSSVGATLTGIHLEGPFLSKTYRGVMPEELLLKPDMELIRCYQEAAQGYIHYITIAPEVEGAQRCIHELAKQGIIVALGHSGANYDITMKCINEGATAATHIFNAMSPLEHHEPGIVGAILESDIYCEALCDGRHLHPAMVRLLLKVKGVDKMVAVTDSMMAAGLEDGEYKLGINDVVVTDGDAKIKSTGVRAGSTLTMNQALKNMMSFTHLSLEEILPVFTTNPAKVAGIRRRTGIFECGKNADIVILDKDMHVKQTFVRGQMANI